MRRSLPIRQGETDPGGGVEVRAYSRFRDKKLAREAGTFTFSSHGSGGEDYSRRRPADAVSRRHSRLVPIRGQAASRKPDVKLVAAQAAPCNSPSRGRFRGVPPPPRCAWSPLPRSAKASRGRIRPAPARYPPLRSAAERGRGTARRAVEGAAPQASLGANQHRRVPHNVMKMIVGRLSYARNAYRFRQLFYFRSSQPAPTGAP